MRLSLTEGNKALYYWGHMGLLSILVNRFDVHFIE